MSNDDRIDELLVGWQENWLGGQDIPAEVVCAESPELIEEVRCIIRKLKART